MITRIHFSEFYAIMPIKNHKVFLKRLKHQIIRNSFLLLVLQKQTTKRFSLRLILFDSDYWCPNISKELSLGQVEP